MRNVADKQRNLASLELGPVAEHGHWPPSRVFQPGADLSEALPDLATDVSASTILLSNHMWPTVILFWVKVPVLSAQMHEVEPKVSTASRFFTRQFFAL